MSKHSEPIVLDGAAGEGGGQILRTGLALSAITGAPIEIANIRARRSKPGLAAQHLTGVRAVAAACDGRLEGDVMGSSRVALTPGRIRAGEYELDVAAERPSAGSVTLVMQALLPVLALADGPSKVRLKGGTHVEWSPSFHYLDRVLRPALAALGVHFHPRLRAWGWYPRGGGMIEAEVAGRTVVNKIDWTGMGPLQSTSGLSVASDLPRHIAERQASAAREILATELPPLPIDIAEETVEGAGQGSFCFLQAVYGSGCAGESGDGVSPSPPCGFSALGRRGKRAEAVGREAAEALLSHHRSTAVVERHLADQILPYVALASGISRFTTPQISSHLRTNAWVCEKLLDIRVSLHEDLPCTVEVHGAGWQG